MPPASTTLDDTRLSPRQLAEVRQCLLLHLGPDTRVWLFGSRLDLQRRGGDVDLYVETPHPIPLREELICKMRLKELLDLPVDLILAPANSQTPIATIAKTTGLELL